MLTHDRGSSILDTEPMPRGILIKPYHPTSPTTKVPRKLASMMVAEGIARWMTGKNAIQMLSPDNKQGWYPVLSGGYWVMQLR